VSSDRAATKAVPARCPDCGKSFVNLANHKKCPKRQKPVVTLPDLSSTYDSDSFRVPIEAPPAACTRSTRSSCSESSTDADSEGARRTPPRRVSRRKRLTSPKGHRHQGSACGNTSVNQDTVTSDDTVNNARKRTSRSKKVYRTKGSMQGSTITSDVSSTLPSKPRQ
jgi:hypothetical protein